MQTTTIIGTILIASVGWYCSSFYRSYRIAKSTGLPIVLFPINITHPLWLIVSVPVRSLSKWLLPERLAFILEMGTYGFEFNLGDRIQQKYGPNWIMTSPGSLEIWIADAGIASSIVQKPKEFLLAGPSIRILGMQGPNVASVNGEDWQRQRRIIAPMINERVSAIAWNESSEQANEMVKHYVDQASGETDSSIEGLRRIAINVLGTVGYGKTRHWSTPDEKTATGYQHTFMTSLLCIIHAK